MLIPAARMAICSLLLASTSTLAADTEPELLRAKVVAYSSGTAFAVLDAGEKLKRVKLAGVDAPERKQRHAPEARQFASQWLGAKPIEVALYGSDKDGRVIGRVVVDGRDVALALIEAGLAWCDPGDDKLLPEATRIAYRAACDQAKAQHRGLWQDPNPMPPWEYRKIPEFAPSPTTQRTFDKTCREIGYQTVQCDDGKSYRIVGNEIIGSDGSVYARRGSTLTGEDGTRYTQQGPTTYGTDGSVCRSRGRQTNCY